MRSLLRLVLLRLEVALRLVENLVGRVCAGRWCIWTMYLTRCEGACCGAVGGWRYVTLRAG